ncbi:MAG: hypothetical protein V4472_20085 [Pseudomonadota bacterium]
MTEKVILYRMKEHYGVYDHLVALRAILLREGAPVLARTVENVLAILDEGLPSSIGEAKQAWERLIQFPRGLPDFGVWREDYEERLRLNAELDAHLQAINHGLS